MKKQILFCLIFSLTTLITIAQNDSAISNLNEIVVTATRSERKLGNVAVPVSIISEKNIKQAGSVRLTDILNEQAGLYLTSGFGSGIQMQGLNPDYTLILLNGEPFIGRTAGVLDLNRITVGNVQKIEIVNYYKGGTTPAASTSDNIKLSTQRYFTFRYTYQGSGSTTF